MTIKSARTALAVSMMCCDENPIFAGDPLERPAERQSAASYVVTFDRRREADPNPALLHICSAMQGGDVERRKLAVTR